LVQLDPKEILDLRARQAPLAQQGHKERRVLRGRQGHKERRGLRVYKVSKASKANREKLVQLDLKEFKVARVLQVPQDHRATLDRLDLLVLILQYRALQAQREPPGPREIQE
jgi:hypothetical protein